jgi:predicted transposase/invertase (TIGR01784 family)
MAGDETFRIFNVGEDRINRLNDRFAKYLLTGPDSKPILTDFINDALLWEGDERIEDLEVVSGELNPDAAKGKLSVLDVSATLMDKRTVDLELQIVNYKDFRQRAPFYWPRRHSKKLSKGMTFIEIKPTITICLLAFDLLEEEEAHRNAYCIRNEQSGRRLCEDLRIIYLELPKFLRHLGEAHPKTGLERWLLYFCNEGGKRMNKVIEEDAIIAQAKDLEASFWADEKEKEQYYQHQRLLMDAYSAEHTFEVLLEQGKKESKAEGEKKKACQIAKNLLEEGLSPDVISRASGLSPEEVRSLMS